MWLSCPWTTEICAVNAIWPWEDDWACDIVPGRSCTKLQDSVATSQVAIYPPSPGKAKQIHSGAEQIYKNNLSGFNTIMLPTHKLERAKSVCQAFLLWCLSVFYNPDMDENLYYKMLNSKAPKSKFLSTLDFLSALDFRAYMYFQTKTQIWYAFRPQHFKLRCSNCVF